MSSIVRAEMLIQQSRFELADKELRQLLTVEPNNAYAHALLGICLSEREKYNEASDAVEMAIQLAPDQPFSFYVASTVSAGRNQFKKAEQEIELAIGMDHTVPAFFAQLSQVKLRRKKWQAALEAAEAGLELDPEDVQCINLRAVALVKLGQRAEAGDAIQSALENAPEDAYSHANMGWSLLESGKPKDAMPHFKEALRLEPNMEWARAGIVESMKSQFFLYRWLLGWFMWAAKLDPKVLIFILVGGYIGVQYLTSIAVNNPGTRWFLMPVIILYVAFVILTWIAVPMFNLLLRFNKYGRLVLSDEEKWTSTLVGICLLLAVGFVIASFVSGVEIFLAAALATGLMTPILATYFASDEGWPRAVHGWLVLALGLFALTLAGLSTLSLFSNADTGKLLNGMTVLLMDPLIYLAIGSQFGVNFLVSANPVKGSDTWRWIGLGGAITLTFITLMVWAFFALLFFNYDPNAISTRVQAPPFEIEFKKNDSLNWRYKEQLESGSREVLSLGFEKIGDFEVEALNDVKVRRFFHPEKNLTSGFSESQSSSLEHTMGVLFQDGTIKELTTSKSDETLPPGWELRSVDLTPTEMLERLESELEGKAIRQISKDELMRIEEELYAERIRFKLARGGETKEELKKSAKADGIEASETEIVRYQRSWRVAVGEKIKKTVLDEFIELNPEYRSKRDSLLCLNPYSKFPEFFTSLKPDTKILGGDLPDLVLQFSERLPSLLTDAIDPEKAKVVGEVDSPIKTTIYLKIKP